MIESIPTPMLSPCIGICQLDDAGYCLGCLRSTREIAAWSTLTDEQRHYIMDVVLPRRESQQA
ncbi:MAG: DUF1289 domain-containing protein [Dokdonella sp.]